MSEAAEVAAQDSRIPLAESVALMERAESPRLLGEAWDGDKLIAGSPSSQAASPRTRAGW
ncbi:MAG TPA: hypothetical protein VIO62_12040 [Candidatus Dormibacteraeota bacterium]|jgi:hypothetical protein